MSTKKDRMRGQITTHGFNLNRIFNLNRMDPVTLAKQVHRIEVKAHRMAEDYCNGLYDSEQWYEKKENSILKSLDRILNFKAQGIPVFVNGDPRGYALKIDDAYVREHNLEIHRDWAATVSWRLNSTGGTNMGKNINIQISDELHYDLRLIAAKTGNTLKSVIILALENAVNKQIDAERKGEK